MSDLKVTRIRLEKFKKVDVADINLQPLNVLVGGNNAGKSSVLQGIHFSIIAAIASRETGRDTFTQDTLLYCPSREFVRLRHGGNYLNQSSFGHLHLGATTPEGEAVNYSIKIYRGRNEGNVGCQRSGGGARFGPLVTNSTNLFSIYVPGLAGIPQEEQYRTESVIRKGVAGGDANLYLRNVLLLIKNKNKLDDLTALMKSVFPDFWISIDFDQSRHIYINVNISINGPHGRKCPLELVGTGVLQALQIFSYVTLFQPKLLLLDEPDSHLHPDNQSLLASTLLTITSQTSTQIIVSTHSRHLVEALYDEANFIWLKDGVVYQQGIGLDRLPFLLDLGALDAFDRLRAGNAEWVVLSEDSGLSPVRLLLENSGFDLNETLLFSYKTSSNMESAKILAEFILELAPDTKVIIHRDRDFMTDEEVEIISRKIRNSGSIPFITQGSDIESYFINSDHLADFLEQEVPEIEQWVGGLALEHHNTLSASFLRKREEVKWMLYRNQNGDPPAALDLMGPDVPLQTNKRLGKTMLRCIRANMQGQYGVSLDPLRVSPSLTCPELERIWADHEGSQ